jgi:ankyrin repeat protein
MVSGSSISALVESGADPNTPSVGAQPETPLHWAASSGDLDAMDALLDAGADIDAPGAVIAGGTALADATAFGQWAAARRLVERGARSNLFEAAALGLTDQVKALLDTNHPKADNINSSFWGACHGGQLCTAAILLDSGADINWIGYDGLTPLDVARRADASQVGTWLEHHGATPSHTNLQHQPRRTLDSRAAGRCHSTLTGGAN